MATFDEKLRKRTGEVANRLSSMARRYLIAATAGFLWRLTGGQDATGNTEEEEAEVFSAGWLLRPKVGNRPEAYVVQTGAKSGHAAVVAIRDEVARKAIDAAVSPADGEGVLYASQSSGIVYIKADGTVEVRSKTGVAVKLLTAIDGAILKAATNAAVISTGAGGAATIMTAADTAAAALVPGATWPIATTTLKGD